MISVFDGDEGHDGVHRDRYCDDIDNIDNKGRHRNNPSLTHSSV